jgi:hypothetical protein
MTTVIQAAGLGKRYRRGVRVDAGLRPRPGGVCQVALACGGEGGAVDQRGSEAHTQGAGTLASLGNS